MTDTATTEAPDRESGRHPVNVGHLVMGVALLAGVVIWALVVGDLVDDDDIRWLLPAPWVLGGAAGLVALAISGHRGRENRQVGWVTPPDDAADTDETDQQAPPEATEPTETETTTEENR
jgi:hypothetical protein